MPDTCQDYAGFLRPEALCQNCGAPCAEHDLPLELEVRMPGDEERCVFCDELKGSDAFEDGLRCKTCAEERDA